MNRSPSMNVRKAIRRMSLAVGITKRSRSPAPGTGSAETVAQFLVDSKERYLKDVGANPPKGGEWTVAMGNEAGDLDSIACSIALAWIQTQVHQKPTVPLIQTASDDLTLRPENVYALSLAGINDPKTQLLTVTDLKDHSNPFPSTSFALVDHNRLGPSFSPDPEHANVVAVVDHHEDEKLYPNASPRKVAPCGSCASHIALLCPSEVPPELATLLLTAVLIDTNGLKPGGKGTDTDVQAVAFLAPRSTYGASLPPGLVDQLTGPSDWSKLGAILNKTPVIKNLTGDLRTRKADVGKLSARDLLRRDYKEYDYVLPWAGGKKIKAGLASVPVSLEVMSKDKGDDKDKRESLEEALGGWVKERGLTVLGVLTSYKGKDGKGKSKREMAWVVYVPPKKNEGEGEGSAAAGTEANGDVKEKELDVDVLAKRLWKGFEGNKDIKPKKHKKIELRQKKLPDGAEGKVYKQGNADANRKVTAPALKEILEGEEKGDEKGKKKLL